VGSIPRIRLKFPGGEERKVNANWVRGKRGQKRNRRKNLPREINEREKSFARSETETRSLSTKSIDGGSKKGYTPAAGKKKGKPLKRGSHGKKRAMGRGE